MGFERSGALGFRAFWRAWVSSVWARLGFERSGALGFQAFWRAWVSSVWARLGFERFGALGYKLNQPKTRTGNKTYKIIQNIKNQPQDTKHTQTTLNQPKPRRNHNILIKISYMSNMNNITQNGNTKQQNNQHPPRPIDCVRFSAWAYSRVPPTPQTAQLRASPASTSLYSSVGRPVGRSVI